MLDGKHAGVSCRACHTAKHISSAERNSLAGKDLEHTWLGLSASCITCHEDKHQGRFGTNCSQCHSTVDWKAAKIDTKQFDHSKTRYPLTGMHLNVTCAKCHTPGADGLPRYAGIQFASCTFCHQDPHKSEFNKDANPVIRPRLGKSHRLPRLSITQRLSSRCWESIMESMPDLPQESGFQDADGLCQVRGLPLS